jgi:hypothetical protein
MATLVYSLQCLVCKDVVDYIKTKPELHSLIQYHNVNDGVPEYIKKVPSMVTNDQKLYAGKKDIMDFLKTLVKKDVAGYTNKSKYGSSFNPSVKNIKLPVLTEEFKQKIEMDPNELLKQLKR